MLQNCKKERNLQPTNPPSPQKTHTHTTTHNINVGCSQEWLLGSLRKGGENNPTPGPPKKGPQLKTDEDDADGGGGVPRFCFLSRVTFWCEICGTIHFSPNRTCPLRWVGVVAG